MSIIKMTDLDLTKKKVFIRSDLNVPIKNNKIISDARILASLPTIDFAIKKKAKVIVASHIGNPIEGEYNHNFSMKPIVNWFIKNTNYHVFFEKNFLNKININNGELFFLENVRFNKGEKNNDIKLAKQYAALCDIYVLDAFGTSHRIHASTHNIAKYSPVSCAGILLCNELNALNKALVCPERPMVAIVGGSKISSKFKTLYSLSKKVDQLIVGGGIANTFIAAKGNNVGLSLYEKNMISKIKEILKNCQVIIPNDVRVTNKFSKNAIAISKKNSEIKNNDKILDLGDESIENIVKIIKKAKTIIWNGPLGMFELPNFCQGTKALAEAIAENNGFSIAGGGDTLAAIELFNISNKISYISTGGGAFIEFITKKKLPTITMLKKCAKKYKL
ncbi:phosphoglycerate kinase [Candidatus Providencia siddallii]|uniref:Phosphoglycerate kinase n=1 Tax=Candidatus Providencia siddallii TaxID=1715285 RepID=A0ABP1CDZ4_9GAMM